MASLEENILDVSENKYKYLMSLKNVNGVGLGYKYINKINTFEPCIHVLVDKKLDEKYIGLDNRIPKEYMGIKTDIIETGKTKLRSGAAIPYLLRPLECGASITAYNSEREGTLGCIVTKVVDGVRLYFMLSNNHVMAESNQLQIGTPIIQPSDSYGGEFDRDTVGFLATYVPLKFINGNNYPVNYADCALARIFDLSLLSNEIFDSGKIKGINGVSLNENVKMIGSISGIVTGHITSIGVSKTVNVEDGKDLFFQKQIMAYLDNDDGDSGAVVLNNNNEAIGLFFGGGDGFAIMNDISIVLYLLGAEIYTGF